MRIGLIDVDGRHGKKKWGATVYPNVALGKIARWHTMQGDEVEWAQPTDLFDRHHYDILYASKVFNFSPDIDFRQFSYDRLEKGGTGYDIYKRLPDEIDRLQPLYELFPWVSKNHAYGKLTEGCPNKCFWCVVPKKEGFIRPYMDIEEIAIEGRTHVVLMDNNILAAGDYAKEQLQKIIDLGLHIDFNQAMDARLVTPEYAELLGRVKWIDSRIRFGCDTTAQIAECERAMQLINAAGFRGEYFLYTMIGGKNDFRECYHRLHYWWERLQRFRKDHEGRAVYAYAQPYRDPTNPNHVIPKWQKDMAQWCNKRMIFCTIDFKDFMPRKGFRCEEYLSEYGMGENETEVSV